MSANNSILDRQKQEANLEYLAAQRELYSSAKTWLASEWIFVFVIAISLVIAALKYPQYKEVIAFLGFMLAIVDALINLRLEPYIQGLTRKAALIQEEFDCAVYELRWQDVKLSLHAEKLLIEKLAQKYRKSDPRFKDLQDWYPQQVAQLPLPFARIMCQRLNIGWETAFRRRFAIQLKITLIILASLLLGACYFSNLGIKDTIYSLFAPLLPAFLLLIREEKKHIETSETIHHLQEFTEKLWRGACNGNFQDAELTQSSRDLQDEIYDYRRSAPFIFDWMYFLWRSFNNTQMKNDAESMVEQYLLGKDKK